MKVYLRLIPVFLLFYFASTAIAATGTDFIPTWHEGDNWDTVIRTHEMAMYGDINGLVESRGKPEYIHFNVLATQEIAGEMCYVLGVTDRSFGNAMIELYVRQSDFTVSRLQEFFRNSDGTKKRGNFPMNNGHECVMFEMPRCLLTSLWIFRIFKRMKNIL